MEANNTGIKIPVFYRKKDTEKAKLYADAMRYYYADIIASCLSAKTDDTKIECVLSLLAMVKIKTENTIAKEILEILSSYGKTAEALEKIEKLAKSLLGEESSG